MQGPKLDTDIARYVWETRYRFQRDDVPMDSSIDDTWRRVAHSLAVPERTHQARWEQRFYDLMRDFRFVPGGRILVGAGTGQRVTLFNCFVMGAIEDSMDGIFQALREGALTLQQGGGVGYDFSTLRPACSAAHTTGTIASGPVSFMRIWDRMCDTLLSTGTRRGAMMATLRCDHPDIEAFIDAKQESGELTHFNLSVLVTDAFMLAVRSDQDWPLVFPVAGSEVPTGDVIERRLPGQDNPLPCRVFRRVRARELWQKIMHAAYQSAEPGVLFIDRINRENNLAYRERISATNPCGEIPLPPYGACDLGSFNLTRFIRDPFTPKAQIDWAALIQCVPTAVRLLDNVIDVSQFPLPQQEEHAKGSRRIGLGVMGLADALAMLGIDYGSPAARLIASRIMSAICHAAYDASVDIAREKGSFPYLTPRLISKADLSCVCQYRFGIESGVTASAIAILSPSRRPAPSACWQAMSHPVSSRSMRCPPAAG